jgi:hypothetical protein
MGVGGHIAAGHIPRVGGIKLCAGVIVGHLDKLDLVASLLLIRQRTAGITDLVLFSSL